MAGHEKDSTAGARAPDRRVDTLCVVAPCFNEESGLRRFHAEVSAALEGVEDLEHALLLVDDGSTDGTLRVMNELAAEDRRVQVASLSRNFGHQAALSAGLDLASGDAVALMDSDLQHPPEVLVRLVERWREGFDVVSAVRLSTEGASAAKGVPSRLFYWLIQRLSDTPIVAGAADFCLLSRRAHAALLSMPEHHRFLRGMVSWLGFPRAFVEYDAPARFAGESKYGLRRMLRLAGDAVFSFSATPIRVMTRVGAVITMFGAVYLAYVLWAWSSVSQIVRGWSSLISTVLILGGLQLVFLGVIGEYVARVFEEVKGRPLYLLKQEPGEPGERSDPGAPGEEHDA